MAIGTVPLQATYNGNGNYSQSNSNDVSQSVAEDASITSLVTSGSPSAPGAPVVLTATVTAKAPGSGTPTGDITFMDGTTSIETVALSAGSAAISTTLSGGSHSIKAVYGGDMNFGTSASQVTAITVTQVGSDTSLESSAASPVFGQLVDFTATVSPASGSGTPAGTVTFMNGSSALATVPLAGGSAVFATSSLPLATSKISATYNGSTGFTASSSTSITENVVRVATAATLSPSANPGFAGQIVTLTATVSSLAPGTAAPSGTVTFKLGKKTLGTARLANGKGTLGTKKLALGANKITVVYSGNADFGASTSGALKEVIKRKPPKKPKKK